MSLRFTANGVYAHSGRHLQQADVADLFDVARAVGAPRGAALAAEAAAAEVADEAHLGLRHGHDPLDLADAGWGLVLPAASPGSDEERAQDAVLEVMAPLLAVRAAQAGDRYRVFRGADGLQPGEHKESFLSRHGATPGLVDPTTVPYYLALLGDPVALPFQQQSLLDVQRAVGRIDLPDLDALDRYVRAVVTAEQGRLTAAPRAAMFAPENPGDEATLASSRRLVAPLAARLRAGLLAVDEARGSDATRAWLLDRFGSEASPALLFAAAHGVCRLRSDPLQRRDQGALLCQEWPGGDANAAPLDRSHWLSGEDVAATGGLPGGVALLFACFGLGTPKHDPYFRAQGAFAPVQQADAPFTSALPQALLGHARSPSLAVIGHIDRVWGASFQWPGAAPDDAPVASLVAFEDLLDQLVEGYPVGAALEAMASRYAELATSIADLVHRSEFDLTIRDRAITDAWTAALDAGGYAVLGDPAVRLALPGRAPRPGTPGAAALRLPPAPAPASPTPASRAPASPTPASRAPASRAPASRAPVSRAPKPPPASAPGRPVGAEDGRLQSILDRALDVAGRKGWRARADGAVLDPQGGVRLTAAEALEACAAGLRDALAGDADG